MLAVGLRLANIGCKNAFAALGKGQTSILGRKCSNTTDGKTTINILNQEPDAPLMVDSYSQLGFRLNNGISVIGPMVIFPKTLLSWNIGGAEDISVESLSLFFVLEPKIDILIIGLGERGKKLDPKVVTELRRYGTNVEMLSTDAACATFNFLNAEKRSVAGALIPPKISHVTYEDLAASQHRSGKLFELSDELEKR
ncbi:NADH dehydrogenase [ubiquinone] 1 alpha subcomplex assembly factor 3 [Ischnura elegans]|uniref:NADH dehydrogenase [ubiquinone] 1 alpha subcomplex assembly factor 3 n=1 Tax=Ischnura elegans TaxID=197161 RepID=UPI001ED87599|nr:NADH dehydrogenase [ubiquinone] 1 alpha subcomplex assembly factor 3 [Ischnura elegans]